MSPYLVFALAMLGIVIVSLVITGNLAANFNERAKRDMEAALIPLAAQLEGVVHLDDARVEGRYHEQIASGRVIAAPGGMGRLFETRYIEPAGGSRWRALVRRPKADDQEWQRTFEGANATRAAIQPHVYRLLDALLPYPGWFELTYDPDSGSLTLTRAMQSRRDVPTPERFARYLETLEQAGNINRHAQGGAGEGTTTS